MGAGREEAQAVSVSTTERERTARPIIRVSEMKSSKFTEATQGMSLG